MGRWEKGECVRSSSLEVDGEERKVWNLFYPRPYMRRSISFWIRFQRQKRTKRQKKKDNDFIVLSQCSLLALSSWKQKVSPSDVGKMHLDVRGMIWSEKIWWKSSHSGCSFQSIIWDGRKMMSSFSDIRTMYRRKEGLWFSSHSLNNGNCRHKASFSVKWGKSSRRSLLARNSQGSDYSCIYSS